MAECEEEVRGSKVNPQRNPLLVPLQRADVQMNSAEPSLNQEVTETPHIKEEPEEQSIKQEEDQLQEFTSVSVKSEEQCSLLEQRQTEHTEETQGEDCGGAQHLRSFKTEALPEICDIVIKDVVSLSDLNCKTQDPEHSSSDTDNSEDWDPPASSSTLQMDTEVDGEGYNHNQMEDNTTVQSPTSKSSPETSETVKDGDISGSQVEAEPKTHQCPVCKKFFRTEAGFQIHTMNYTGGHHSCPVCHKTYIQVHNLKTHMTTHRDQKPYSCSICQKTFIQNSDLKNHIKTHTDEKPYSCSICEKTFSQSFHLKTHVRTHTGEKPYSCSVCKQTFITNSYLKIHMRKHTGEKPYSCSFCKKTFFRNNQLNIHMRIHTGERPYSCLSCEKTFIRKYDIDIHMRTHTGERPYSCSICKKTFIRNYHFKTHMKTHAR